MPFSPSVGPLTAAGPLGGVNWDARPATLTLRATSEHPDKTTGSGTLYALAKLGDTNT